MKRHLYDAASSIRTTLLLSVLGCLLAAGLGGAVWRPASAARVASASFSGQPGAAPQDRALQVQELGAATPAAAKQEQPRFTPLAGGSMLELRDGRMSCRDATAAEAQAMQRDPGQQLRVIGDQSFAPNVSEQARNGLKIILRGTPQLEGFPEARAAFLRAARAWESLIQNSITVVIDVDFGPTFFGEPFGGGFYGKTRFQWNFDANIYPVIRAALIRGAGSPQEAALYNALPAAQLPTNLGATTGMIYHVAAMRALGLFPSVADPDAERNTLGLPPAIAFNSVISFDFDPSDGIKPNGIDFNAAAMHEIGHALGFFSGVGLQEIYPNAPPQTPDVLDMFRFRPGVTTATFATASRILSSGGEHIFFGGGPELPLSTGRPDNTGGDGKQAGHWKDDTLTGRYIGIMNPTFDFGSRYEVTANDLEAFERIGYRTNPLPNPREAEMQLDDGAIDAVVWDDGVMVVNRLTPPSYPATLRKLRILIPQLKDEPDPAGKPITLLIGASSNSNGQPPTGAQFTRIATTVPSSSPYLFLEFTIPNGPTIDAGDFYVGYQAPSPYQGVGFAVDLNGLAANRSFYSSNNGAGYGLLSEVFQGKAASAMIRAIISIPGPAPAQGKVVSVSAASFNGEALAGDEIVAAFGARLATTVMAAPGKSGCPTCLSTELAGTTVKVKDSRGIERLAPLFFVSPSQVNYLMPSATAVGPATVTVTGGDGAVSIGTAQIANVAPGLFTANSDGQGVPAALAVRVIPKPGSPADLRFEPVAQFDAAQRRFTPLPLDLGPAAEELYLALFGTGLGFPPSTSTVSVKIGGLEAPVQYAGFTPDYAGLDQVNVRLPRSLIGRGEVDLVLTAAGKPANTVKIKIK
ncbi:MAG: NF038122 family metalloprotease [Blastocatellia bacterium]